MDLLRSSKNSVQYLHLYTQTTTYTQLGKKEIKGKRTGVQPLHHQTSSVIKANSFNTLNTFENRYAQFEWISISLMPVLSKEHRNTYAMYEAEMVNYVIRKITISNLKDINNNNLSPRVYYLDKLMTKSNFTGTTWHIF